MTQAFTRKLTLDEFLSLPEGETACELIDGEAIPKVFPTRFHSKTCGALILLLQKWVQGRGGVGSGEAGTTAKLKQTLPNKIVVSSLHRY